MNYQPNQSHRIATLLTILCPPPWKSEERQGVSEGPAEKVPSTRKPTERKFLNLRQTSRPSKLSHAENLGEVSGPV